MPRLDLAEISAKTQKHQLVNTKFLLYRCGPIIGHFTVHSMVGYILSGNSTVTVGVSCELLRYHTGKCHAIVPARAIAGLVVPAPRIFPRRLGVRLSTMQQFVRYHAGKGHAIGQGCSRSYRKSPQEKPTATLELPDKMYPTILCSVKCPVIRPQRCSTLQKSTSGYQQQVGSDRVARMNLSVRRLANSQFQHIPVSFTTT